MSWKRQDKIRILFLLGTFWAVHLELPDGPTHVTLLGSLRAMLFLDPFVSLGLAARFENVNDISIERLHANFKFR